MSYLDHKKFSGDSEITIREIIGCQAPKEPRWFDFEGTWEQLIDECRAAHKEDQISEFTVEEHFSDPIPGKRHFSVWEGLL